MLLIDADANGARIISPHVVLPRSGTPRNCHITSSLFAHVYMQMCCLTSPESQGTFEIFHVTKFCADASTSVTKRSVLRIRDDQTLIHKIQASEADCITLLHVVVKRKTSLGAAWKT